MKSYPSIPALPFEQIEGKNIIAFDKIDGSNIRAEWSKKKGFYKFGSRKHLIDEKDLQLGEAVSLILDKDFDDIFDKNKVERAVCFFEFWGKNSSFGSHVSEKHKCTLIDVSVYKKGIIDPDTFLDWFFNQDIPNVLYHGIIDEKFYQSVRDGSLSGIGSEGVVCKGDFEKSLGHPWMVKIKRQSWYDRLKCICKDDIEKYKELK